VATTTKKSAGKGLAAEVTPSSDLAAIVGSKPMPRSQVTKAVWTTSRQRSAGSDQQADDQCGRQAAEIFNGKKQVSMFEMTALVNKHLKA